MDLPWDLGCVAEGELGVEPGKLVIFLPLLFPVPDNCDLLERPAPTYFHLFTCLSYFQLKLAPKEYLNCERFYKTILLLTI